MPKSAVHGPDTPLHRGFSIFIFNDKGEVLLQQRSALKKVWPLIWSNSCCGHPGRGERNQEAASRRLQVELGILLPAQEIREFIPDYYYRTEKHGIVEHEICSVMVARYSRSVNPNPQEVADFRWLPWQDFCQELEQHPEDFSPWCREEVELLKQHSDFHSFIRNS